MLLGWDVSWDRSIKYIEWCNREWEPLEWDVKTETWVDDNIITGPGYTGQDLYDAEVLELHTYGDLTEVRLNLD